MAKLAIDRASIVFGEKSGDFHSKSGDREILIILSKIGRSPEKSGDLEALRMYYVHIFTLGLVHFLRKMFPTVGDQCYLMIMMMVIGDDENYLLQY